MRNNVWCVNVEKKSEEIPVNSCDVVKYKQSLICNVCLDEGRKCLYPDRFAYYGYDESWFLRLIEYMQWQIVKKA